MTDMLEYLDTFGSDSAFILESDIDNTNEEGGRRTAAAAAHHVSAVKSMIWMMKTTGKFCHLRNLFLIFLAYIHLFFSDLILTLMVTKSNRYAQQVINSKVGNVFTPLKNWTRITMHEMKGFLTCLLNMGIIKKPTILVHSLFPSHIMVWENVY
jgi:hypothetical protein